MKFNNDRDRSIELTFKLKEALLGVYLAEQELKARDKKWEELLGRPFDEHCRLLAGITS